MKKFLLVAVALVLALLLPALPAEAGHGHRYYGGWGWGWGWGWGGWGGWGWGGWGWGGYGYPYGRVVAWERVPGPAWTVVDTDVSPEHAEVWLDGVYIGVADDFDGNPDYLYLARGDYKLEFRLGGYQTLSVSVKSHPGGLVNVDEWMPRAPDTPKVSDGNRRVPEMGIQRLWVKKNGQTQVYQESNEAAGREQQDEENLSVEAETWSRRQEPSAGGSAMPPPAPEQGEGSDSWRGRSAPAAPPAAPSAPPAAPPAQPAAPSAPPAGSAALLIAVEPPDAAVWIDDKYVGTATDLSSLSRGVPVAPGKHKITVLRPGWGEETVTAEVDSGEIRKVRVALKKQ